jgi:hypothetical protein
VPELEASVQHENAHDQQHDEEQHEMAVVPVANAVIDPGAVVIKLGHTSVAGRAVLRADRTPN